MNHPANRPSRTYTPAGSSQQYRDSRNAVHQSFQQTIRDLNEKGCNGEEAIREITTLISDVIAKGEKAQQGKEGLS